MSTKKIYSAVACIGVILFSGNSFADSKIVIQPKLEVGFQNDSNFWKTEDNEKSVNTYYMKPGIVLGYETPRTQISLDTSIIPTWYHDKDSRPEGIAKASDDDYTGFEGILGAKYQLSDRLNIGLQDQLYVTRESSYGDTYSNSVDRNKYTINYLEPSAYYELTDKFGLRSAYRNTNTDYEKNLEDSNENRGIFDLYYNLNSFSATYLDYQVWNRSYDQDTSDYTSNQVTLNYEHSFNYFSFLGGAGYHHRKFNDPSLDSMDLFTWNLQVNGIDADSTEKTTRSRMTLDVGQAMNDDGTGDDYYTATYIRFAGGYRFTDKIETSGKAQFQNSDYDEGPRDDDKYLLSGKLAYQPLDYLTLAVEGGYETRDSNLDVFDYDNKFVLFTLAVEYDLENR